jgi:tetrahydromethanopterin S-methyltransferase subunit E
MCPGHRYKITVKCVQSTDSMSQSNVPTEQIQCHSQMCPEHRYNVTVKCAQSTDTMSQSNVPRAQIQCHSKCVQSTDTMSQSNVPRAQIQCHSQMRPEHRYKNTPCCPAMEIVNKEIKTVIRFSPLLKVLRS